MAPKYRSDNYRVWNLFGPPCGTQSKQLDRLQFSNESPLKTIQPPYAIRSSETDGSDSVLCLGWLRFQLLRKLGMMNNHPSGLGIQGHPIYIHGFIVNSALSHNNRSKI